MSPKKPLTLAELENIAWQMLEEDKSGDVESDTGCSEVNIDTNDFDILTEQSISCEIN